jgi:hypothetical protein
VEVHHTYYSPAVVAEACHHTVVVDAGIDADKVEAGVEVADTDSAVEAVVVTAVVIVLRTTTTAS